MEIEDLKIEDLKMEDLEMEGLERESLRMDTLGVDGLEVKSLEKKASIGVLRRQIQMIERPGSESRKATVPGLSLGWMDAAFPGKGFPTGAVHEFISPSAACATASNGFIAGIISALMEQGGSCLWVSTNCSLFPPALSAFGIRPHDLIFVEVSGDREALWVMEQGLQCNALAAVVAELSEVSFKASRRLQLSVEQSRVTGFLHRRRPSRENTLACISRFRIRPVASRVPDGMPGLGYPQWEVRLEKIRNGAPGRWLLEWQDGRFVDIPDPVVTPAFRNGQRRYA